MRTRNWLNLGNPQPYVIVLLLATVWIAAAALRPETTLHLGPVLLPIVPLIASDRTTNVLPAVIFGVVVGTVVLAILGDLNMLDGPALEPFNSVVAESVFALLGAGVVGALLARLTRRGVDQRV